MQILKLCVRPLTSTTTNQLGFTQPKTKLKTVN